MSTEIVHAVKEGLTDIGIYNGNVPAEGLQEKPYRQDRLMLIAPIGHPLADRSRVTLQELAEYDLVALRQDSSIYWLISQSAQKQGITLRVRVQAHSFDAICRMIEAGLGVGILPDKAVESHIRSMRIVAVPISGSWAHRQLNLCIRNYNSLSVIARQMFDHLSASSSRCDKGRGRKPRSRRVAVERAQE
jgi:DNA-binding transcriptional LysR family regulator